MSSIDLDKYGLPVEGSPKTSGTAEPPSIGETLMAGGYYFDDAYFQSNDEVTAEATDAAAKAAAAETSNCATLPSISSPAAATRPISTAAPAHKAVSPLSSLSGTTPTPADSNADSTHNMPMPTNQGGAPGEALIRRRLGSDSAGEEAKKMEAEEETAAAAAAAAAPTSLSSPASAAATASSSPKRPTSQKAAAVEALSPPKLSVPHSTAGATTEATTHSTPLPRRPASDNRDAIPSVTGRTSNQPVKPGTPNSAPVSNTHFSSATAAATLPPLSPKKANFVPMPRVTATPQSSTTSMLAAATVNYNAEAKPVAVTSRLAVAHATRAPASAAARGSTSVSSVNNNSTTLNATAPTSPFLTPAASGPNSATSTPPPPQQPYSLGLNNNNNNNNNATAAAAVIFARPQPPPSPSRNLNPNSLDATASSPNARRRVASPRHPTADAAADETAAVENDVAARPKDVPQWLAELNHALLHGPAAAPSPGNAQDNGTGQPSTSDLAQHRTFSQAVTSSDDWLNPCSRPKGLAMNTAFYASSRPAATAAGLPPGVSASQYDQHLREDTGSCTDDDGGRGAGSSQTSLTDTNNTSVSHGTPNNRSISNSDVTASTSNLTAPFTERHWRAEDGATVRRQYPSRHSSLAGSITSTDNAGFIPISREQRTMSPQSQRWESSGGLSLYSSVGENALADQHTTALHTLVGGALPGLPRRSGSNSMTSRGSGDIMAPVRLNRNDGGAAAAIFAGPAITIPAGEVAQLAEMKLEPPAMPLASHGLSLQPTSSSEELALPTKSAATPQRCTPLATSALGSASVLSTNEGPSTMRLQLARFMRNASGGSAVCGRGNFHVQSSQQQQQLLLHNNNNNGSLSPHGNSPPAAQQQQGALASAHPSTGTEASRLGCPPVLSLHMESPNIEKLQKDNNSNANNASGGDQRAPTHDQQPPHQPLHQGHLQAPDGNADVTTSLTLTPTDAMSNVSRATSGISLATETTFVECD